MYSALCDLVKNLKKIDLPYLQSFLTRALPDPAEAPPPQTPPWRSAAAARQATRRRMTTDEANAKAKALLKETPAFAVMSETAQANAIGCHLRTWRKTDLRNALARRRRRQQNKTNRNGEPTAPPAAPLPNDAADANAQEPVHRLIEEEERHQTERARAKELRETIEDYERHFEKSPLEKDNPGQRARGPKQHKRG
jgi:hypothetical protein